MLMLNIICRFKDTFLLLLLVCNKSVTNLGIPYAVYSIFPRAVYSVPLDSHLSMCLNLTGVSQAGLKQMLKCFAGSSLALITSTITSLLHLES